MLVTHLIDPGRIAELAVSIGANTIQVHGEMALAALRRLRVLAPGVRLLKAVHVTGEDALGRALAFAADVDALLLDSRTADRLGGTGRTHDWAVSARIVAAVAPLPGLPRRGAAPGEREGGGRAGAPGGGGRQLGRRARGRAEGPGADARVCLARQGGAATGRLSGLGTSSARCAASPTGQASWETVEVVGASCAGRGGRLFGRGRVHQRRRPRCSEKAWRSTARAAAWMPASSDALGPATFSVWHPSVPATAQSARPPPGRRACLSRIGWAGQRMRG